MNRSNTIYYRFKSEKKKFSINFDTTEISIGDIKKEIIRRRNMEKAPEKFELLCFDENNNEIRDENYKIEPLKLLMIKRIPWYKLSNTFVESIRDPNEISSMRFSDFAVNTKKITTVNFLDPLEKINNKINLEIIAKKFGCSICTKLENDPVILFCCGNTICEKCANESIDKKCFLCTEIVKGFMANKKEKELKERLINNLNKQALSNIQTQANIANLANIANQANTANIPQEDFHPSSENTKPNDASFTRLPQLIPLASNTNESSPYNTLFDNARFFIIKSSNKENVDLSQKYSEWATTVTNQKKLNEAFQNKDVILIFSVNKSGMFQGYAVMTSFISDKVSNIWQNESSVKLGGSFSVHWVCTCEMAFAKVKNLVNPLNSEPVIKSRDTQELPKDIGTLLCNYCNEQEKYENMYKTNKSVLLNDEILKNIYENVKKSRESKILYINLNNFRIFPKPKCYYSTCNDSWRYYAS